MALIKEFRLMSLHMDCLGSLFRTLTSLVSVFLICNFNSPTIFASALYSDTCNKNEVRLKVSSAALDTPMELCSSPCEGSTYTCPATELPSLTGKPVCALKTGDNQYHCALACNNDADCPSRKNGVSSSCVPLVAFPNSNESKGICLYNDVVDPNDTNANPTVGATVELPPISSSSIEEIWGKIGIADTPEEAIKILESQYGELIGNKNWILLKHKIIDSPMTVLKNAVEETLGIKSSESEVNTVDDTTKVQDSDQIQQETISENQLDSLSTETTTVNENNFNAVKNGISEESPSGIVSEIESVFVNNVDVIPDIAKDTIVNVSNTTYSMLESICKLILIYIILGCIFRATIQGKTGKDIIPNREFFTNIPASIIIVFRIGKNILMVCVSMLCRLLSKGQNTNAINQNQYDEHGYSDDNHTGYQPMVNTGFPNMNHVL